MIPQKKPNSHGNGAGHADLATAQPELKEDPAVEGGKDKNAVRKGGVFGS
ncbi:MAG: hypothetical protein IKW50_04295 [Oscillospiraceae bacterium]|nr:hypothetical protein [Oscillospiraceae bacterium]